MYASDADPFLFPICRYLWPLIHYHKFLARCIKKLKRNGVDVKHSVSPVAVFLREEVCSVSDHLAAVSMFDSDEWMACLRHFTGWIIMTEAAEAAYRSFVSELPLRSLQEPGDVNSPLLRSQIDENFLRTMVAQREQMRETSLAGKKPPPAPAPPVAKDSDASTRPPPPYPRGTTPPTASVPRHIHGVRRPRYYGWWNGSNWEQTPPPQNAVFGDNSSVQSGLSYDSYPHQPPHPAPQPHYPDYNMYGMHPYSHYGPPPPPPPFGSSDQSHSNGYDNYNNAYDWSGGMDPHAMYGYGASPPMEGYYPPSSPAYYHPPIAETPVSQEHPQTPSQLLHTGVVNDESSPPVFDPNDKSTKTSPYWAHLDQATLAMGLATPAKATPSTPQRKNGDGDGSYTSMAQPPLLRQHYYGPVGSVT